MEPLPARPFPPPHNLSLRTRRDIHFLHPGYPAPHNILLTLPRVDPVDGANGLYGVHHGTALIACQIIANNSFAGYLSSDREGRNRTTEPIEGILVEETYFFIVEGFDTTPYPIVPSFKDWEFPHDRIPDWWLDIPPTSVSTSHCGITNAGYSIEQCHLVPKAESEWYNRNGMNRYGLDLGNIDNKANIVPIKNDIHTQFDTPRWFAIVPKLVIAPENTHPSQKYVTHILKREGAEFWPDYHNVPVRSLNSEARPYLFARLAWAVLFQIKTILITGRQLHVIRLEINEAMDAKYTPKFCTGKELDAAYGAGGSTGAKSRTITPRKRRPTSTPVNESGSSDSDMDDEDIWDVERGFHQKQNSSEETAPEFKVQLPPGMEDELVSAVREVVSHEEEMAIQNYVD